MHNLKIVSTLKIDFSIDTEEYLINMSTDHCWCPDTVYIFGSGKKINVIPAEDDTCSDAMIEHAQEHTYSGIMSIFCWNSVPPKSSWTTISVILFLAKNQ